MSQFAVFIDGLEVDLLDGVDNTSRRRAASQAINKIATSARKRAADMIRDQVNLPVSYVSPANRRLYVSEYATPGSLEAKISAQGRATSLARFTRGSPKVGKAGVYVEVSPGKARYLKKAFIIKLPGLGGGTTDSTANLGLAIRLKPGETMKNKLYTRRVASGLYALYGPSVSQIFRANDGDGVASDMAPRVADDLTKEFLRLIGI